MRLPDLGSLGQGWVILQLALLTLITLAGTADPAWSGALGAATSALGAAAIVVGALLMFLGARALGASFTPLPRPLETARLVETGIYAQVRHPIYGGLMVAAFGYGGLTASPLALVLAAILAALLVAKTIREEAWLVERYAGYPDYRRRTRRFFPRLI